MGEAIVQMVGGGKQNFAYGEQNGDETTTFTVSGLPFKPTGCSIQGSGASEWFWMNTRNELYHQVMYQNEAHITPTISYTSDGFVLSNSNWSFPNNIAFHWRAWKEK
jgi:hypothetical protein